MVNPSPQFYKYISGLTVYLRMYYVYIYIYILLFFNMRGVSYILISIFGSSIIHFEI